MESVAELLKWVLENLNYWVVTIFMAIESSFIPFPSEAVVPPAAWKAMADDSMNIFLVVLFATIGADIGALVNYYLCLLYTSSPKASVKRKSTISRIVILVTKPLQVNIPSIIFSNTFFIYLL